MTCKDCIHYKACSVNVSYEDGKWSNPTTHCRREYENMNDYCDEFDDKSQYITGMTQL